MRLGIKVCLGSDWSPTASKNLLNELKVAQIFSRDRQIGLTDPQLVEMVTITPAQILGWQGLLGSIEPGKLADLNVVAGQAGDPYSHLVDATEEDIGLVIIAGTGRYGTPALLQELSPVDEQFDVAGLTRAFHLDTRDPDPVLGPIGLGEAATTLAGALEHMPERAAGIAPADLGLVAHAAIAGVSADERWFLELDQPAITGIEPAPPVGAAPALLDAVAGTQAFAPIAVPLHLDPLATKGDDAFFAMLANLANLPEAVRAELPGRYGEVPRSPTADALLADNDAPLAPSLRP